MIPNAAEIVRRRVTTATIIRLIAVTTAITNIIPLSQWVAYGIRRDFFEPWILFPCAVAVALISAAAILLWSLAPWLSRVAMRVPRVPVCPGCLYKLHGINAPQCPECGLTLTDDFLGAGRKTRPHAPKPETLFLRQIAAVVVRLAALAAAFVLLLFLIVDVSVDLAYRGTVRWEDFLAPVISFLVIAPIFFSASIIAARVVPTRRAVRHPDPKIPIASAAAVVGAIAILTSGWAMADYDPGLFPVFTLSCGIGVVLAALAIFDRSRFRHAAGHAGASGPA